MHLKGEEMTRIGAVVTGLVLVAVDIQYGGFDILPDVLGWIIVAIALSGLNARAAGFGLAAVFCGLAAVVSMLEIATTETSDAQSGARTSVFGTSSGGGGSSSWAAASAIFGGVALALICWAVSQAARAAGDAATDTRFSALTFATAFSGAVTVVMIPARTSQIPASLVVALVVLGLALFVGVLVSLLQVRTRDYLTEVAPVPHAPEVR